MGLDAEAAGCKRHVESPILLIGIWSTLFPPAGSAGRSIHIRGSKGSPGQAMIAVKRHGWWYSIDSTDAESKLTFHVIEALMSVRMAEANLDRATPVLTVPASR